METSCAVDCLIIHQSLRHPSHEALSFCPYGYESAEMYITRPQMSAWIAREESCRAKSGSIPLLPLTNASPYVRLNFPFTYSLVCSRAIFMYPSTDWSSPVENGSALGNHDGLKFQTMSRRRFQGRAMRADWCKES